MNMRTLEELRQAVEAERPRSAWDKGVKQDALELLDLINEDEYADACNPRLLEKLLLNGADSWGQYSWGGCWLIYDSDIAERYCTASELKKTKGGKLRPNKNECWIEVQARALGQAAALIMRNCRQDEGRNGAKNE